ncbi:MAG: YbjN domain-containing protein [Pirellulales bacterium]
MTRVCCLSVLIAGVVLVVHGSSTAPRAAAAESEVVAKMSAGRIERLMQQLGLQNVTEIDNNTYRFEFDGVRIVLFNKGDTLRLYTEFSGTQIRLSRINEWNRVKRFVRAYLDEDDDAVLEGDLQLTGGVTEQNVSEWIKTYQSLIRAFRNGLKE